jgi:HEAT repeat protein
MGPFDKAFDPAWKAVIGIGGPDVLDQCKKALKSWNPRSRHAAILILRDLGLPESRPIAGELLGDLQQEAVARCALNLLYRLGITKEDVPAMVEALAKIQNYYLAPVKDRPKTPTYGGDVATSIIFALGSLGPDAKAALPVLDRFATDFPLPAFQADAKGAIEKIKSAPRHEK